MYRLSSTRAVVWCYTHSQSCGAGLQSFSACKTELLIHSTTSLHSFTSFLSVWETSIPLSFLWIWLPFWLFFFLPISIIIQRLCVSSIFHLHNVLKICSHHRMCQNFPQLTSSRVTHCLCLLHTYCSSTHLWMGYLCWYKYLRACCPLSPPPTHGKMNEEIVNAYVESMFNFGHTA